MLSLKEGSYTVSDYTEYMAGTAWHCPENTEPYASATMRTPVEVTLGDHPYVRLGVNPGSGPDAPTKVQLKYKHSGTNIWETLTMNPEPHGDGWLPKYDGNAYYTNCIPIDKFKAGMTVQYYFYLEYENSSLFGETSVGTTDQRGSIAYMGANEAKAHPFQFTVREAPVLPLADYVWHVPDEIPSGQSTWSTPMRNPYALTEGVTNVTVFLGNYQADTEGECMTGGSIFYSIDGAAFFEEELVWSSEVRNGDDNGYLNFWKYDIDTAGMTMGQTLRYYFAAEVAGRATTYVISDGAGGMVRTNAVNPAWDNLFTATCGRRYCDPEGSYIEDPAVIDWLRDNGFTQADIDALGKDAAAVDKFYKAYIANYDFRVQGADASITFTDITTVGDDISVTVQLVRTAPLGALHGKLYIYGANDLTNNFSRLVDTSVSFGKTDETFDTQPTAGTVTQTATATLSWISYKFFQAQIHAEIPDNGEW